MKPGEIREDAGLGKGSSSKVIHSGLPKITVAGVRFFPLQYGHGEAIIPYMKQRHLLLLKISWRRVANLLAQVKNKFTTILKCKLHTCVRGIYRAQEQEPFSEVENY